MTHYPMIDALILAGFAAVFSIPVYLEWRRKQQQPKPRGATKI